MAKKKAAKKAAPRKAQSTKTKPAADSLPGASSKPKPEDLVGRRATYNGHGATIKAVHADGTAHLAVDNGTEVERAGAGAWELAA